MPGPDTGGVKQVPIALALLAASILLPAPAAAAPAGRLDALVEAALRNDNYKVRLKAAAGLGRIRHPRATATLVTVLGDPHPLVRAAAANALGELGDPAALPGLCGLRGDRDAFVRRTVEAALGALGGPARCAPRKVFVAVEVHGDDPALAGFVRARVLERCAGDARIALGREETFGGARAGSGPDPRAEVAAGRLPGVELKLRVARAVERTGTNTTVRCSVAQSVFDMKLRALRGSATQRAEIDLGTPNVTDEAAERNVRECLAALVPVVYEGLSDYLDRMDRP